MKISTRLSLGFFLIVCTFLVLTAFTGWKISLVSQATARMEVQTQLLNLAARWQANVKQNSARSLAIAYGEGTVMLDFFKASMDAVTRDTTEVQKHSSPWCRTAAEEKLLTRLVKSASRILRFGRKSTP